MHKEYLLPSAILIGCAIIGPGAAYGLRSRGDVVAARAGLESPASVMAAASGISNPGPAMPQGAPFTLTPAPAVARAATEASAAKALLAEKNATFVPKCWAPIVKKNPLPAKSRYSIHMTFDLQGKEITRGISEERGGNSRLDVANCLRTLPLDLQVKAPGVILAVELPLEFP